MASLSACVQKKPGDAACLAKAGAGCEAALAKLAAAEDKTRASIAKGCGELTASELADATGLGYAAEVPLCPPHVGQPNWVGMSLETTPHFEQAK